MNCPRTISERSRIPEQVLSREHISIRGHQSCTQHTLSMNLKVTVNVVTNSITLFDFTFHLKFLGLNS